MQNCYFGAPGHRTKSWGLERVWTHGRRQGQERQQNGDVSKDEGKQILCFILDEISSEYSFTLLKLQLAELKHQVKVTTITKI